MVLEKTEKVCYMSQHTHTQQNTDANLAVSALETVNRMANSCANFIAALTPALRRKAELPFVDAERLRWHYVPVELWVRQGVMLGEMNHSQRQAAFDLLACGLSERGYRKTLAIIELETTLGELERAEGNVRFPRVPDRYYFTVFGDPTNGEPWSWRVEGHHVSLHFTIVNGKTISPNPSFFGSNPAEVRHGLQKGLRILSAEEDLARELLVSLTLDQKRKVIFDAIAPHEILTREQLKVDVGIPKGLAAESMESAQREILAQLLHEYINRLPEELSKVETQKLCQADLNQVHFAWAGGEERGKPHYYSLHGPFFFAEYDNTQDNANHAHSVWRHIDDDFGVDLLRLHYQNAQGTGHHEH